LIAPGGCMQALQFELFYGCKFVMQYSN